MAESTAAKRPREEDKVERSAKRFAACDYNDVITVLVGPKKQSFIVHKHLIIAKSKFFKAACSRRWIEGQEGIVRLPGVRADIFKSYVNWVYMNKIDFASAPSLGGNSQDIAEQSLLMELFILGDVIDDIMLRNEAIKLLVTGFKDWNQQLLWKSTLQRVYDSTLPGSRLRQVLVDTTILRLERADFAKHVEAYPAEMLRELAVSVMNQMPIKTQEVFEAKLHEYLEPVSPGE